MYFTICKSVILDSKVQKKNEQKRHTLTTRPVLQGACELARAQQRQQHQEKKSIHKKLLLMTTHVLPAKFPELKVHSRLCRLERSLPLTTTLAHMLCNNKLLLLCNPPHSPKSRLFMKTLDVRKTRRKQHM